MTSPARGKRLTAATTIWKAAADVYPVWEFIAEDSLEAADRIIDAIEATIEALVAFPHQGHRRPLSIV